MLIFLLDLVPDMQACQLCLFQGGTLARLRMGMGS